jgi:hypothetical protein
MRQILVDSARRRQAGKRAGLRVSLAEAISFEQKRNRDLVALDLGLTQLERVDFRKSKAAELGYFGGLSTGQLLSRRRQPLQIANYRTVISPHINFHQAAALEPSASRLRTWIAIMKLQGVDRCNISPPSAESRLRLLPTHAACDNKDDQWERNSIHVVVKCRD